LIKIDEEKNYKKLLQYLTPRSLSWIMQDLLTPRELNSLLKKTPARTEGKDMNNISPDALIENLSNDFFRKAEVGKSVTFIFCKKRLKEIGKFSKMETPAIEEYIGDSKRIFKERRVGKVLWAIIKDKREDVNKLSSDFTKKIEFLINQLDRKEIDENNTKKIFNKKEVDENNTKKIFDKKEVDENNTKKIFNKKEVDENNTKKIFDKKNIDVNSNKRVFNKKEKTILNSKKYDGDKIKREGKELEEENKAYKNTCNQLSKVNKKLKKENSSLIRQNEELIKENSKLSQKLEFEKKSYTEHEIQNKFLLKEIKKYKETLKKHDIPRVGVFVDVQNIYYGAKKIEHKAKLNFSKLLKKLTWDKKRHPQMAIAYIVQTPEINQDDFIKTLENVGYEIKSKDLKRHADGSAKGDWDLGIAMDIISSQDELDVIVLVSGDGDFIELIKFLKGKSKIPVEVAAFQHNVARDLKDIADDFHTIGEELII